MKLFLAINPIGTNGNGNIWIMIIMFMPIIFLYTILIQIAMDTYKIYALVLATCESSWLYTWISEC